ncbi:MAG: hypothetical protein ACI4A5_08980 [Hominilimicola sp.]
MAYNTKGSKLTEGNISQIKERMAENFADAEIDGVSIADTDDMEFGYRYIVAGDGQSLSDVEWIKKESGVTLYGEDTGFYFRVNQTTGAFESSFDNTFLGEFTRVTDAQNNVMVNVPLYYIKEEFIGVYKYVWFCAAEKDGYRPAQFFVRSDGSISDYVLVGAYEMGNCTPGKSLSGMPYSNDDKPYNTGFTRAQYRTAAKANGAGYGLRTVALTCDLFQKLMTLEFGTRDIQVYVAGICTVIDGPHDEFYPDLEYRTGMCNNVPNLNGIAHITDNAPDGAQFNLNGQTGLNCGANPFVWRGFENPFGCLEEYDDGLNFYNGEAYVTNDMSVMAENTVEGYEKLSYSVPVDDYGYIISQGYDAQHPWAALPTKVDPDIATGIYFADEWEPPAASGYRVSSVGGNYSNSHYCGVFARYAYYNTTNNNSNVGSRLF